MGKMITAIVGAFFMTFLAAAFFLFISYLVARSQMENGTVDTVGVIDAASNEHSWVTNPSSGVEWYVRVLPTPNATTALVLVPGGRDGAATFIESERGVTDFTRAGYAVVVFDPEGRGQSVGVENHNGAVQQDGLKAIVDYAALLPGIERVGIVSFSYGITMASGMMARYPEASVAFLVDWEGPANRTHSGGCDDDATGHITDAGCGNTAFWSEREAEQFIGALHVPYLVCKRNATMRNPTTATQSPW